jgi:hypothetical protein
MTPEEKFQAIIQRVPVLSDFTPTHISCMVITRYLEMMADEGLVSGKEYAVTPLGKNVMSIIEEFDWKPTDEDIEMYVSDMVPAPSQDAIRFFIKELRDNREEFMERVRRFKSGEFE